MLAEILVAEALLAIGVDNRLLDVGEQDVLRCLAEFGEGVEGEREEPVSLLVNGRLAVDLRALALFHHD